MTDKYGNTPLHMACQQGNVDAVKVLMNAVHIDLTPCNGEKNTPLHEACLYGHTAIVKIILEKLTTMAHTKWWLTNNVDQTPLHLACREGHHEIVKLLLGHITASQTKKELLQAKDKERSTALHLACENGNVQTVKLLLENGAQLRDDEDDPLRKEITPLHAAASLGHTQVVKTLLEKNSDLALIKDDLYHQTPVHYAVRANDSEILECFKEILEKYVGNHLEMLDICTCMTV